MDIDLIWGKRETEFFLQTGLDNGQTEDELICPSGSPSRTRRLHFSPKFEHGDAVRGIVAASRFFSATNKQAREILMLKFYFNGAPNPTKVALFLEESGLPCELVPVDTRKGDQFKPEFLKVNPNGKVPAIDDDGVFVFDSNAILLYLAEKTGKFLPPNTPSNRAQLLSWLMFVASGVGPYSGQAVHFKHHAPKDLANGLEYATNRYQFEAQRHYGILNDHLANSRYMVGDTYTIVDMAFWGWARLAPFVLGDEAFAKYPNVKRLVDEISARPAAARAIALKDKFTFKAEMDDEARNIMFRHLKTKAA
jgi:GST-like protein